MMQLTNVRKTWQPFVSNKEPFQAIERAFGFGFGGTAAHNCIAAYSKDYSLAIILDKEAGHRVTKMTQLELG